MKDQHALGVRSADRRTDNPDRGQQHGKKQPERP